MSKKPLLSISLLSSGRSNTIERCLSSLMVFKEHFDTEIIVVDTDTEHNQEVHEILEKYADQIIPFEWCDDFAKARNTGLKASSGEWFLFVDDDEWFIDASPIIDFLTGEDVDKYEWANIRIRNFKNWELTIGEYAWVSRLFRIGPDSHFEGAVHEFFEPSNGACKNLETTLGHTGYIYQTTDDQKAHARRNLAILNQLLEKEPNQVRWVMQAMTEYDDMEDWEKELEYARRGYKLMKGAKGRRFAAIRGVFASNQLRMYTMMRRWDECLRLYDKLKSGEKIGRVASAQMELDAARSAYELDKNKNAALHCRRYLDEYDRMVGKPVDDADEYLSILSDTFRKINHDYIAAMSIQIGIQEGEWDPFDKYFDTISWAGSDGHKTDQYEHNIFYMVFRDGYSKHLCHLVNIFWNYDSTRKLLQKTVSDGMIQGAAKAGDPLYWGLIQAIAEVDSQDHIPWDIKILWANRAAERFDKGGDESKEKYQDFDPRSSTYRKRMQSYFSNLFDITNPLLIDPEIWRIGLKRGALLDSRIAEIPMDRWQALVGNFVQEVDPVFASQIGDILEEVYLGLPDDHYNYFMMAASDLLREGEAAKIREEEARKKREVQQAARAEMKMIIEKLEYKVDELVAGGMIDEADRVLQEIQKFSLD